MINYLIEQSIVSILVTLAASIGVHDTHVDKAAIYIVAPAESSSLVAETAKISVNLHTHTERGALADISGMENPNPHRHARARERKHMKDKHHLRGGRQAPLVRPF